MKNRITIHKLRKVANIWIYKYIMFPSLIICIQNTLYWLFHRKKCILIDGYLVDFYHRPPKQQNWGDALNVYLLEKITNKKVIPIKTILFNVFLERFIVIGSVIPNCVTRKTIIWGSGVLDMDMQLFNRPLEVLSVRGPLTRKYLLKHNIFCPEIYGDPALLLPRYYTPKSIVKKHIGLIPYHRDYDSDGFDTKMYDQDEQIRVIDVHRYDKNFFTIIDEICACDIILSSSLHGLIVADAYRVRNVFCEFDYRHPNYDKYIDYFLSVKRSFMKPLLVKNVLKNLDCLNYVPEEVVSIDLDCMLSVTPFL